eukprot:COSAG06_NODE_38889_length_418_cov_1.304075_1_plen_34_part_10
MEKLRAALAMTPMVFSDGSGEPERQTQERNLLDL